MRLDEDEKRAILALLTKRPRDDFPQPNFTVLEIAEALGITKDQAYRRLEDCVLKGTMGRAKDIDVEGSVHGVNLYWRL